MSGAPPLGSPPPHAARADPRAPSPHPSHHHPAPPTTPATAPSAFHHPSPFQAHHQGSVPSTPYNPNSMTLYQQPSNMHHQPAHTAAATPLATNAATLASLLSLTGGGFPDDLLNNFSANIIGHEAWKISADPSSFNVKASMLATVPDKQPLHELINDMKGLVRDAKARKASYQAQAIGKIGQNIVNLRASLQELEVAKRSGVIVDILEKHLENVIKATDDSPVPIEQLTVERIKNFKFGCDSSAASIKAALGIEDVGDLFKLGNVPRAREVTHALSEALRHYSYGPEAHAYYAFLHDQGVLVNHPGKIHLDQKMAPQGNVWEQMFIIDPQFVIDLSETFGVKPLRNPSRWNSGNPFDISKSIEGHYFYADSLGIERHDSYPRESESATSSGDGPSASDSQTNQPSAGDNSAAQSGGSAGVAGNNHSQFDRKPAPSNSAPQEPAGSKNMFGGGSSQSSGQNLFMPPGSTGLGGATSTGSVPAPSAAGSGFHFGSGTGITFGASAASAPTTHAENPAAGGSSFTFGASAPSAPTTHEENPAAGGSRFTFGASAASAPTHTHAGMPAAGGSANEEKAANSEPKYKRKRCG